ncbi:DNA cytosine methyltransferase [Parvibaculum sp.]|uniref:DNA cytosine methyltransferase n=1 Tax=Parvibaculum sp. TaxID=2024848 RepID=UPI002BB03A5D|nr:DNA cytosine methyltransferase [Parvibaculum sp.]HUD51883.1 DNA cytosine methyltransferase [Parvibaculum sp.]
MAGSGIKTIDLFSGCGGFSLGAHLAGCKTLAAVDIDANLQSAYKRNFPKVEAVNGDVAKLDEAAWKKILGGERPDAVIGGPPCQGFSRMGKRDKADPRNDLVGHFYRQVDILRPKFFVMENVEGLLDAGNGDVLDRAMEKVAKRYTMVGPVVVDAADFGAATSRRRVIVVGFDPDEIDLIDEGALIDTAGLKSTTVSDAIRDLPPPIAGRGAGEDFGWADYPEIDRRTLSAYAKRMRAAPPADLGWKKAREYFSRNAVSGLFETVHTKEVVARFKKVKPGKPDTISKCPRLSWDGLCPTLRAGTGSDKGSFQSIRPIHPTEPRVITVREAARLQGFPDWFVFHPTKWHSFRMIGNSVSPVFSQALLSRIVAKGGLALAA